MTKRMLIDATHEEETRVAVVDGTRLSEFDYESKVRKQLKGTIFLAKVTRVEPSLQAAFVNFGGNRHGFLPFAEIHPDYYRIPIADREALIAEQRAEMEAREAAEREQDEAEERHHAAQTGEAHAGEDADDEHHDEEEDHVEEIGGEQPIAEEDEEELDAAAAGDAADEDHVLEEKSLASEQPAIVIEEISFAEDDESDDEEEEDNNEDDSGILEASDESEDNDEGVDDEDEAGHPAEGAEGEAQAEGGEPGNQRGGRGRGRGGRYRGHNGGGRGRGRGGRHGHMASPSRRVEVLGGDGIDGDRPVRPTSRRHYKIQEVIKRGQIMLIQVSKEERGNKGAAVTTYLSLPGRYCVLMPNSPRGGGVSRKIANFAERKRMREILAELNVPEGMSVIMRTAGMSRTKVEIKRDLDYLLRLWDEIRELTLQSNAPALIHEEGNLIRRAVRDLYSRDIEEIVVSGEEGFKSARDFMKVMMPSHLKRVVKYEDDLMPLFQRYQVESQIRDMGEPNVTLRSGGYLVINPTEALVSVDVNSGRATRERHIEDTALKTNLEAAEEVARQLRLRDLGGLVVIDFIDMEDRRNNAKVERKLKESLSTDRARIQMGRISSFGLMELSRQRLNPSLTEAQFEKCKYCQGQGHTRTVDNAAILALRSLESEGMRARAAQVHLSLPNAVAIYILNHKRAMLADIERRYEFEVLIRVDETLLQAESKIEIVRPASDDDEEEGEGGEHRSSGRAAHRDDHDRDNGRGRRERGGRGRGRGGEGRYHRDDHADHADQAATADAAADSGTDQTEGDSDMEPGDSIGNREQAPRDFADGNGDRPGRRRGRRGGRGRGRGGDRGEEGRIENLATGEPLSPDDNVGNSIEEEPQIDDDIGNRADGEPTHDRPRRSEGRGPRRGGGEGRGSRGDRGPRQPRGDRPRRSARSYDDAQPAFGDGPQPSMGGDVPQAENAAKSEPKFYGRRRSEPIDSGAANDAPAPAPEAKPVYDVVSEPGADKKKGWWSRK